MGARGGTGAFRGPVQEYYRRGASDEAAVSQAVEPGYVMFDPFEQKQVGPV